MNITVLCLLFPTVSVYYWNKITELRDSQLENTLKTIQSTTEAKGVAVVQSVSFGIHEAVAGFDFSFVNNLLTQVVQQDVDLSHCVLMDENGVVFSHNDLKMLGSVLNQPIDQRTRALFSNEFPASSAMDTRVPAKVLRSKDDFLHVVSPIYNGKVLLGALRCTYSTAALNNDLMATKAHWQAELVSIRNTFISIVFFFFILAVVIAFMFTGKLVSAINKLIVGVDRVAGGDLLFHINRQGLLVKEFQSFAAAFNHMTVNLKASRKKIDEHNQHLEATVKMRTSELEATNKELEAFSYSVSHDLRAPLRAIDGFSNILLEDYPEKLDDEGKEYLAKIKHNSTKMGDLISGMLTLSRLGRSDVEKTPLNLNGIIEYIIEDIKINDPEKNCKITIQPNLSTVADFKLVNIVLENLLSNAWKYSHKKDCIEIEIGALTDKPMVFYVKDNGAGFDMEYVDKLFSPFQRLHKSDDFVGIGIGLATVARIIHRHSGKIWADSALGEGTTFFFSFESLDDDEA